MLREFRLWGEMRSAQELQNFRFQQIDIGSANNLMTYVRFSEESLRAINLASFTQNASFSVSMNRIAYTSSADRVLICPVGTFYDSDNSYCVKDPFQKVIAFITAGSMTLNDSTSILAWNFNASLTGQD
jgi:hypothetical protein